MKEGFPGNLIEWSRDIKNGGIPETWRGLIIGKDHKTAHAARYKIYWFFRSDRLPNCITKEYLGEGDLSYKIISREI